MSTKKLISKYLAFLWLGSLLGFIGLQVSSELSQSKSSRLKSPDSSCEIILLASHHGQASEISPDQKLLPDFILPNSEFYRISEQQGQSPGFEFHPLLRSCLIRILRTSISINAP